MPPIGTVVADRAAVDLLTAWVEQRRGVEAAASQLRRLRAVRTDLVLCSAPRSRHVPAQAFRSHLCRPALRRRRPRRATTAATTTSCEAPATARAFYTRPAVAAINGLVTAGHPLASLAGLQMLMKGGNAIDAAVAVGATLNMMEPQMNGIGGNGFMTVYDKKSGNVLLARDGGRDAEGAEAAEP